MYKFLNNGDNSLAWRVRDNSNIKNIIPEKAGTYVFVGGLYHNVKKLDSSVLAHC
jgi:hypothetical protein